MKEINLIRQSEELKIKDEGFRDNKDTKSRVCFITSELMFFMIGG